MSATPNNAGSAWIGSASEPERAGRDVSLESGAGREALEALLAFACVQEQASIQRGSPDSRQTQKQDFGLDEVLRLVAARALSITGADGVAIALAEDDAIECRASTGRIAPDPGVRLDPNSGFSGVCLRRGQTVRCDDSDTDARVNAEACRALGARSMIAVPLAAKQRVIGLIEAFSTEAYGFNDADVKNLDLLGELILAAIRPEEEDRLAELASKIVVPEPTTTENNLEEDSSARTIGTVPTEITVEEKPASASVQKFSAPPKIEGQDVPSAETIPGSDTSPEPRLLPQLGPEVIGEERSVPRLALIAALLVISVALGWAVIWKALHIEQSISASTRPASPAAQMQNSQGATVLPPAPIKPGTTPRVTGIRHWSSAESSTVVIDLQDQVQYEAHSLENPPRIYFDLHDTKMTSELFGQSIDVDDAFVKRIRVAQPVDGITRVVLETKAEFQFSVSLDPNPYRLTINVHKPAMASEAETNSLTSSRPSPAVERGNRAAENAARPDSAGFKIVLDAGHGGWDLGTVGRKGLLEKDLVLDITQRLGQLIGSQLGAQVLYTRQDDSYLPLEKRAQIANLSRADFFLSVHANYSDLATARGVETYYTNTYSSLKARTGDDDPMLKTVNWTGVDIRAKVMDSHRLATDVQQALYGGLVARNREIRNRGVKAAQYVVLTGTQMPAVLAEVSFVSSPADEDRLQSSEYRQQIAQALYQGVAKYYQGVSHAKISRIAKIVN